MSERWMLRAAGLAAAWQALFASPSWSADPATIPMDAKHWEAPPDVRFVVKEGFTQGQMVIPNTNVAIQDTDRVAFRGPAFADGTIEYDVQAVGGDGGGVFFRRQNAADAELFYWRGDTDCPAADDCIQYVPDTHGLIQWELFPQYQHAAPTQAAGWNHFRLVFAGRRLAVYVNREARPSLVVERLAGRPGAGGVQILGPGTFANVSVRPGDIGGLPPEAAPVVADPNMPRQWSVQTTAFGDAPLPTLAAAPSGETGWRPIEAGPDGMVNLSDALGSPGAPAPAIAWLKTTIVADRAQVRHVQMGWVRQAAVFVNGNEVFSGQNAYGGPDQRFPFGRVSLLNASFDLPLQKGRNRVLVAVGNRLRGKASRYSWAAGLRLDAIEGLRFEPQP